MKFCKILYLVPCILYPASFSYAEVRVENVQFSQREGSNLVDIYYDLSDTEGGQEFTISVSLSADGGRSYTILPQCLSGDYGAKITPGRNKHILWEAGAEFDSLVGDNFVFKVIAKRSGLPSVKRGLTYLGKNDQGYEEYRHEKTGIILIKIPAGIFTMGSNDGYAEERPAHRVYLDEYYIGKYEVTNEQYRKFCDATARRYPEDPDFLAMANYFVNYPNYPVVNVSWNDAKAFCDWAGLRLPTEAEWEKAARGTDLREFPWGNEAPDAGGFYRANYHVEEDGYACTAPVGTYEQGKSPYGCYDMAGNVWEWCADWYDSTYYRRSRNNNPQGPSSGQYRVQRGGSWDYHVWFTRCTGRNWDGSADWYHFEGFRVGSPLE